MLSSFAINVPFLPPSPQYQYKKNYEKSKGHYHTIPDNLEQLHLKEATELQSVVSWPRLTFFLHILQCKKFWCIPPLPPKDGSYSNHCLRKYPKILGALNLATCWNKCLCYEWEQCEHTLEKQCIDMQYVLFRVLTGTDSIKITSQGRQTP